MNLKNCNITIFGDSITKGIVSNNEKIDLVDSPAVKIVSEYLNTPIQNISVYGQTLSRADRKGIFKTYLHNIDKSKKNIVVIALGGNDSDFVWSDVSASPNLSHEPKTPTCEYKNLLQKTIDEFREKKVVIVFVNLPPINSERYFKNVICKIANGEKVLEFFKGDISVIYRHQELYNMFISEFANRNDCIILDIRSCFLPLTNNVEYFCEDGVHPNEMGHKLMAQAIISQIRDMNL